MTGLLKAIFSPHDGSRRQVQREVAASREALERAANKFEETIRDLLEKNDKLTGRTDHAKRL